MPTLRPYQITGRDFLRTRRFALLGDAMGLGKSPQSITAAAAILADAPAGSRVCIVAPAATLPGLAREVATWAPGFPVHVLSAKKGAVPETAGGFFLVAWTSLAARLSDLRAGPRFLVTVFDEAHRAKNPAAKQTRAALGQWKKTEGVWNRTPSLAGHSDRVWGLTGTPVPNRPIEMQPFLHLGLGVRWASRSAFGDKYCRQPNRWAPQGFDYMGAKDLDVLRDTLRREGVLLRRTPEDVPGELPTLQTSIVPLSGIRDAAESVGLDPEAIREAVGEGSPLPFEEMAAYRNEMGTRKAAAVISWVSDWLESNPDGALVLFAWHRDVAQAIADGLGMAEDGGPLCFVATGDDTPAERQRMVDDFAAGARRVFIGSIAACGTGLNGLHKRTTVCAFAEFAWTPGELAQAIGRVRRFGSASDLALAFLLVAGDSLEEYILQTIAGKLETSAAILGDGAPRPAVPEAPAPAPAAEEAEKPDPIPDPTEAAWAWRKLDSGAWGVSVKHAGAEEWAGAVVPVKSWTTGAIRRVALAQRLVCGPEFSVWAIADPEKDPALRAREYFRRRCAARGVGGSPDADELTEAEAADAAALHAAAVYLTQANPDGTSVRNDVGWNKADAHMGATLATIPPAAWDVGILRGARAILRKYTRTQVPAARAAACPSDERNA